MTRTAVLAVGLGCSLALPALAAEVALRHDPFRPVAVRTPPPAAAPSALPPAAPAVAVWRAQLRAVLVDGERSLANVDGVVVRVGGEVDGFRLMQVSEGRALFLRNGQHFELTMDSTGERP